MLHSSTTIHPLIHQRTNPLWRGNENLSTIKLEKEEETLPDSSNNGESETMEDKKIFKVSHTQPKKEEGEDGVQTFAGDEIRPTLETFEFSNSNIAENGVIPEGESDLPPPPGQGQPRCQLQTTIKLPSKDFCLNRALPHLNLVMKFEDEEVQVLQIDLHNFLQSLQSEQSLPQPPPENPSVEGKGNKDIADTIPSSSSPLTPSSAERSEEQLPIPVEISPQKELGSRKPRPKPRNKKQFARTEVNAKVNLRVGSPRVSAKDAIDKRAGLRYRCYFCHMRFRVPSYRDIHILVHTGEKPYSCDKCSKQFNQKCNLTRHQCLHEPTRRPSFPCEECGMAFTAKQGLTSHVNVVHRGEREFGCPECDRKFGRNTDMMSHLQGIHFRIRHPCPKPNCGKNFAYKSTLRKHQNSDHPTPILPNPR